MATPLNGNTQSFQPGRIIVPNPVQSGPLEDIQSTNDSDLKALTVSTLTESVKGSEKFTQLYTDVRDHVLTSLQTEKSLVDQVNKKRRARMRINDHIWVLENKKVCPRQNEKCDGSCNLPHNPSLNIVTPKMASDEYARVSVMKVELFGLLIAPHNHNSTKDLANTAIRTLKAGGSCASRANLEEFNRSVINICAMVNAKIDTIAECMAFTKTVGVKNLQLTEELKQLDKEITKGAQQRSTLQNALRFPPASAPPASASHV